MNNQLIKASLAEVNELQYICRQAYAQNFGHHWNENGLELYLEAEFGTEVLSANLKNDVFEYYFIQVNGTSIGFIQLNHRINLPGEEAVRATELKKIYILPQHKGGGTGSHMIQQVIGMARSKKNTVLFLYVIDQNFNAIAFYEKVGFRFHSKTRVDVPFFKDELRGMHCMYIEI
ncbi:GNAT family N-acetyltransferase [Pedobacter nutrimenti]|uniref:Putative acetyltransferase n=1 Tax=Pedobacter nutrimenti TaxID=1241337 RepID=A0A318UFC7_9SPHI|nr:GNAT family N-acetyltransferase [Pedobacter nutrimenti]PYF74057.1 putative acetyltransferase [Pedobacter nutrimenti]